MAFYKNVLLRLFFKRVNCEKPEWLNNDQKENEEIILSHVKSYEDNQNYNEAIELLNKFIRNGKRSANLAFAFLREAK